MRKVSVRSPGFALVFAALAFAVLVIVSIKRCDGHLIYSLDDPYIHMAVAHNILHGGYGVNLSEASSPSSSIIWPWMVALTEALGLGMVGPLVLNAIAAFFSVLIGTRFLSKLGYYRPGASWWSTLLNSLLMVFVVSAVALPMTGLEHAWHVLAVVIAFDGLVDVARGEKPSKFFYAAVVLMPLIRFEGAAFAGSVLLALFVLGQRRQAIAAGACIALGVGAYAAYMTHLHLPLVPSSVLLKSAVASTAAAGAGGNKLLHSMQQTIHVAVTNRRAQYLLGSLVAITLALIFERRRWRFVVVYLAAAAAICAHLLGGQYGWFFRYEVYVNVIAAFAIWMAFAHWRDQEKRGRLLFAAGFVGIILGIICVRDYGKASLKTPLASRNIYEQQYQMRRFALDFFTGPVAVNDLGLVSYQNPNFVLDLYGLGSEKVRLLKMADQYDAKQVAALVDAYHVTVIMIYDEWFSSIVPAEWKKVALLKNMHLLTAGAREVAFYAAPSADLPRVMEALRKLQASLPAGDSLDIF